jgi:hypothetical protein
VTFRAPTGSFSGQSCSASGDTLKCTASYQPSGTLAAGTYNTMFLFHRGIEPVQIFQALGIGVQLGCLKLLLLSRMNYLAATSLTVEICVASGSASHPAKNKRAHITRPLRWNSKRCTLERHLLGTDVCAGFGAGVQPGLIAAALGSAPTPAPARDYLFRQFTAR